MCANPSNSQQKPPAFRPKPLSIEQENAIDLLLLGQSDREVAEAIGVTRWSVQQWRTSHPLFITTLAQRRESLFSGTVDRLRALLSQTVDNIRKAITEGDVAASFPLLKATGIHGFCLPVGELDPQKCFDDVVMRLLAQEKVPDQLDLLIDPLRNPERDRRKEEIEAELRAEFGQEDQVQLATIE